MTYKKYTNCVEPGNFIDLGFTSNGIRNIVLLILVYGAAGYAAIVLLGGPIAITIAIATITLLITFLYWWLNGRLICLGEDTRNCAIIGMVLGAGQSDPRLWKKAGDNDFNMNVLLPFAPTDVKFSSEGKLILSKPKEAYWEPPQGHLVAENAKIVNIPQSYVQQDDLDLNYMKRIHCEFEGDGIQTLLYASCLILAILVASLLVPYLWIVGVIIALLILFRRLLPWDAGTEPGHGSPLDVNPNLGELNRGDFVVFKGEWVYDSLHIGWNEIHPVKCCQKLEWVEPPLRLPDGRFDIENFEWKDFKWKDPDTGTIFSLDSLASFTSFQKHWCDAFEGCEEAEENGSRSNPVHDWGIHPSVDGCKPPDIIL